MSHEDFVTYEQADKLCDLGFDYKCIAYYDEEGFEIGSECPTNYNSNRYRYNIISAPTLSQVQKWFFEEKKIYIEIDCTNELRNFGYELKFEYDFNKRYCTQGYRNPNEALSQGINDAIRYIEENDQEY